MSECLTSRQIMKRLNISGWTLAKMIASGKLHGVAFKPAGCNEWRFDAEALEERIVEWKRSHMVAAGE